jgi:hypothetical protein
MGVTSGVADVAGGYAMLFSWVVGARHWEISDTLARSTGIDDELYKDHEHFVSNKS